ncbi:MAG: hypothetical protein ABH864_06935 [archaeon]
MIEMKFSKKGDSVYEAAMGLVHSEQVQFGDIDRESLLAMMIPGFSKEGVRYYVPKSFCCFGEYPNHLGPIRSDRYDFLVDPVAAVTGVDFKSVRTGAKADLRSNDEIVLTSDSHLRINHVTAPTRFGLTHFLPIPFSGRKVQFVGLLHERHCGVDSLYKETNVIPVYQDNPHFEAIMGALRGEE